MPASKHNNPDLAEAALPSSIAHTMRLVQRAAQLTDWNERIAAYYRPPTSVDFGTRLFRRFETAHAPGIWASTFAQRFVSSELEPATTTLTLAPHAPAQRQVSAARQGALSWASADPFGPPAAASPTSSIARASEAAEAEPLMRDLMHAGWRVQSHSSSPSQRVPEQPGSAALPTGPAQSSAEPIRRSLAQPIQRTPEAQPPAAAQPIQRTPEAQPPAAVQPIQRTPEAQPPASASLQPQATSGEISAADGADESVAVESPPILQTAATRPMTLFRGPPQHPLMRMGLSETTGDVGDNMGVPSTSRAAASGELPVVRPARPADNPFQPSSIAPSTKIARRVEMPAASQPSLPSGLASIITSTQPIAAGQAPNGLTESAAQPEVQRTPDGTAQTSAANDHVASEPIQRASDPTSHAAPASELVQRASDPTSHAAPASELVQRASDPASHAAPASADPAHAGPAQPVIARTASESTDAPAAAAPPDRADSSAADIRPDQGIRVDPSASDTAEQVSLPFGDRASTARSTPEIPAVPPVQRAAHASAAPMQPDAVPSAASEAKSPPAAHVPLIHRQVAPAARGMALDTVLPLATRLLQRYSTSSTHGAAAPMPLLRIYAPSAAVAVMRSTEGARGPAALPLSTPPVSAPPGPTSATSPATPLLRRSAIVPALPTSLLQREPAGTAPPAATPAGTPIAAPTLEWSALPLLQRLSLQHALPGSANTPSTSAPNQSVAAQVLHRLPLDASHAAAAPMPLLRMQAPTPPTSVLRTSAQSPESLVGPELPAESKPSEMSGSAIVEDAGAPTISRSAILPPVPGLNYQPLPLLRMHTAEASTSAEPGRDSVTGTSQAAYDPAAGVATTLRRAADYSAASLPLPALPAAFGLSSPATTTSAMSAPSLRRSAIVPSLPLLQREPVTTPAGTVPPAATPAAAHALEWSALPLLQRLNIQHILPTPAAGTTSTTSQSVAARVLQRLALDNPHGATAPMPLLRMQQDQPSMPDFDGGASTDMAGSEAYVAHDSIMESSAAPAVGAPALVRRSAILPSLPSLAPSEQASAPLAAHEPGTGVEALSTGMDDHRSALPFVQRAERPSQFSAQPALFGMPMASTLQRSTARLSPDETTAAGGSTPGLPLLHRIFADPHHGADPIATQFEADGTAGGSNLPSQMVGAGSQTLIGRTAPELALLRPTRPDIQRSPEHSQIARAEEASAQQTASSSAHAPAKSEAAQHSKQDIEKLAQQVYARLRRRLMIDRERLGQD